MSHIDATSAALPLPVQVPDLPPTALVLGRSAAMVGVRNRIERVAVSSVPVLICGETGVGKKVLAQLIHGGSPRRNRVFAKVNCAGMSATLIESELFGHERGLTPGGTVLLDDIAELDPNVQARLIHALQDRTFVRVGGRELLAAEFRLICTTTRNLQQEVMVGRFRQDLYYGMNVVSVELPPLRSRRDDIPGMVEYFVNRYASEYACSAPRLSRRFIDILMQHDWPGNIRELENLIRRCVILGSEQSVMDELLQMHRSSPTLPFEEGLSLKARTRQAVREIERQVILEVLWANNWNMHLMCHFDAAHAINFSHPEALARLVDAYLQGEPLREVAETNHVIGYVESIAQNQHG